MMPLAAPTVPRVDSADGGLTLAFERAYAEGWTPVFRLALAWTNDWAAAEDLAQDAFVRLWHNRRRVDWSTDALPWLLTATRHLATDRFRSLRRRLGRELPREAALEPPDRTRWLDVRAGFARLSSLERSAVALTAVSGLGSEEAAAILGTTSAAVRSALFRARRKLEEA
jgi:RNA polymerase sigma-70 factor (ECF subfamily)